MFVEVLHPDARPYESAAGTRSQRARGGRVLLDTDLFLWRRAASTDAATAGAPAILVERRSKAAQR